MASQAARLQLSLVRNSGSSVGASRVEGTRFASIRAISAVAFLRVEELADDEDVEPGGGQLQRARIGEQPLLDRLADRDPVVGVVRHSIGRPRTIANSTRCSTRTSASGSPETAIRSAE